MKVQLMLLAGALTGLSLVATPALSQDRPSQPTPRPSTPPTTPSTPSGTSNMQDQFHQAMQPLVGTWQVTARMWSMNNAPPASAGSGGSTTPGASAQGATEVRGTSTRRWMLDQNILAEDVQVAGMPSMGDEDSDMRDELPQATPPSQPGQPRPSTPPTTPSTPPSRSPSMGEMFQGHGVFGFDPKSSEFQNVWADTKSSKLTFSTGRYDQGSKTFTFNILQSGGSMRPGTSSGSSNPAVIEPQAEPRPGQQPTRPSTTQRPGSGSEKYAFENLQRIVIRIQDDSNHTVEYIANNSSGQPVKIMEINYTKR